MRWTDISMSRNISVSRTEKCIKMSEGLVKSAARVMAIFECFEDVKRPLTISELVRLMGVPPVSYTHLTLPTILRV